MKISASHSPNGWFLKFEASHLVPRARFDVMTSAVNQTALAVTLTHEQFARFIDVMQTGGSDEALIPEPSGTARFWYSCGGAPLGILTIGYKGSDGLQWVGFLDADVREEHAKRFGEMVKG